MINPLYKVCTVCEESKPLEEYYEHPNGKFGRQARCKTCLKALNAAKYRIKSSKQREARIKAREFIENEGGPLNDRQARFVFEQILAGVITQEEGRSVTSGESNLEAHFDRSLLEAEGLLGKA